MDKLTYGAILKSEFPEFVLVPVGGKDTVRSFADVRDNILNKTIWGVDFYLLCDRDAANILGREAVADAKSDRIKVLPRYHLENYFLDETVLARAFSQMEQEGSWLRDAGALKQKITDIAREVIPYAVALNVTAQMRERVGNVSVMPKGAMEARTPDDLTAFMLSKLEAELTRVQEGLGKGLLKDLVTAEFERLTTALGIDDPVWRADLPGRIILNKLASAAHIQSGRLKQLYLAYSEPRITFAEIVAIFEGFRSSR